MNTHIHLYLKGVIQRPTRNHSLKTKAILLTQRQYKTAHNNKLHSVFCNSQPATNR